MMTDVRSDESRWEVQHISVVLEHVLARYELGANPTAHGRCDLVESEEADDVGHNVLLLLTPHRLASSFAIAAAAEPGSKYQV